MPPVRSYSLLPALLSAALCSPLPELLSARSYSLLPALLSAVLCSLLPVMLSARSYSPLPVLPLPALLPFLCSSDLQPAAFLLLPLPVSPVQKK